MFFQVQLIKLSKVTKNLVVYGLKEKSIDIFSKRLSSHAEGYSF